MDSIHDLYDKVKAHPDYVAGTYFTRADVADALDILEDEVTDAAMQSVGRALNNWLMAGSYSWEECIQDYKED